MKHLTKYVDQLNFTNRLFKKPLLDVNKLSHTDIDHICSRLNSDFSPENLTHDGELSRAQVQQRVKFLNGVVSDLQKLGYNIQLEY